MDAFAYMDGVSLGLMGVTVNTVRAFAFLRLYVRIVDEGGVTMVGVPIGTDEYVLERALEVVRDGGAGRLARCFAYMPDKQAAALVATESSGQKTSYLERALNTGLSLEACRRADNGVQWAYEKFRELPGAAKAQSFFQEGCPGNQLTLNPHQQAQSRRSTGAGRLGLPSTERGECLHPLKAGWGLYRRI